METTSLPAALETTTRLRWKLPQSSCCLGNHYPTPTRNYQFTCCLGNHYPTSMETTSSVRLDPLSLRTPPLTPSRPHAADTAAEGWTGVGTDTRVHRQTLSGRVQHTTSAVRACPTHYLGCEGVSNTPPRPRSVLPRQEVATGNIRPLISRLTHNHNKQTNKQARETQADSAD